MARPSTDLPRMQNQARTRAALERSVSIAGQAIEKHGKESSPPEAGDDAAIRFD